LINHAACGEVIHNDDTTMKILSLVNEGQPPQRKGMFTTGIVSIDNHQKKGLFFTGRQHAGENLADLLAKREADLGPPIQMCDALSRNLPKDFETLVANCLGHGRRRFADVHDNFPEECAYVLKLLGNVYKHDAEAKEKDLSAA
jgi:hypothetical protein